MPTILVVEDDSAIASLLKNVLDEEGYDVIEAADGEEAIHQAIRNAPHLIILDIMLPRLNGFAVINTLRHNIKTAHIPILVLSARRETMDKLRAFSGQVDDYLTKPFDLDELLARIRIQLRHVEENLLSPLTGLPGGLQVEKALKKEIQEDQKWSILYLDLNNFKAYNDVYGFLQGNEMIRLLSKISREVTLNAGNEGDFVGHIGGDDFVIITTPEHAVPISEKIISRFSNEAKSLYKPQDVQNGYITATDRRGTPHRYPLAALAIGIVTNEFRPITTIEEISQTAAEVKHKAKETETSSYYIDHRGKAAHNRYAAQQTMSEPHNSETQTPAF